MLGTGSIIPDKEPCRDTFYCVSAMLVAAPPVVAGVVSSSDGDTAPGA
jgi:hypothetical protein